MSELMALAVSGDAFIYRRSSGIALIDGGGSSANLGKELAKEFPRVCHLDIVVCTHADLDHANGLKSVLTHWRAARRGSASIGEFWLPGRWMDVARRGLTDPKSLLSDLIRALDDGTLDSARLLLWAESDEDEDGSSKGDAGNDAPEWSLAQLADIFRKHKSNIQIENAHPRSTPSEHGGDQAQKSETASSLSAQETPEDEDETLKDYAEPFEPDWLRELRERQVSAPDESETARVFKNARRRVVYRIGHHPHLHARGLPVSVGTSVATGYYCLALIDAAEAIVSIAKHAIEENVPIRWFDQDQYAETGHAQGGRPGFLLPMNAVELRSIPTAVTAPVVFYVILTKANRESLAFYAPAEAGCHGVVFCADSRLGTGRGGTKPFQSYASMAGSCQIGTAPHHGAESAARAYSTASKFGIAHWVCAANGRTRPGPSFRKIAQRQRCCTACHLIGKPLSTIRIDLHLAGFALPTGCVCP